MSEDTRDRIILGILLLLLLLLLGWGAWLSWPQQRTVTTHTAPRVTYTGAPSVHVLGGNGTPAASKTLPLAPVTPEPPLVTGVTPVAPAPVPGPEWSVGLSHRCRVLDGRAHCEGTNRYGESGNPDLPVKVEQVVAGQGSTCARGEGRVFCWGFRQGPGATSTGAPVEVPLQDADQIWNGPGGTVCAVSITSGGLNQKGSDDPGSLWCWGEGISADGVTGRDWSAVPVKVAESSDWDNVIVGWRTVCALQGEVELWCWGGQPDGTHKPGGAFVGRDKAFRGLALRRVDEAREQVCGLRDNGTETCYG
jgi:hypothetical protein